MVSDFWLSATDSGLDSYIWEMRLGLLMMIVAFTWQSCRNCDCATATLPSGLKPPERKKAGELLVNITAENKVFAGRTEIPLQYLDSLLATEISKKKLNPFDTVTVVVSADSAATYGILFNVLRAAKKQSAKVVANIQQ